MPFSRATEAKRPKSGGPETVASGWSGHGWADESGEDDMLCPQPSSGLIRLPKHNEMVVSRQDGRLNQKRRTRRAIIEAAAKLVRGGQQPSVAEAAEAAVVSKATAYRYFPTQHSLLLEVGFEAIHPSAQSLLAGAPED